MHHATPTYHPYHTVISSILSSFIYISEIIFGALIPCFTLFAGDKIHCNFRLFRVILGLDGRQSSVYLLEKLSFLTRTTEKWSDQCWLFSTWNGSLSLPLIHTVVLVSPSLSLRLSREACNSTFPFAHAQIYSLFTLLSYFVYPR